MRYMLFALTTNQWFGAVASSFVLGILGILGTKVANAGRHSETVISSQDRRLDSLIGGLERRSTSAEARLAATEVRLSTAETALYAQIQVCRKTEAELQDERVRCDRLEQRLAALERKSPEVPDA